MSPSREASMRAVSARFLRQTAAVRVSDSGIMDEPLLDEVGVKSEEEQCISEDDIVSAAIFTHDAFDGKYRSEVLSEKQLDWYVKVHLPLKPLVGPAVVLLWLLPFFEQPGWCQKRACSNMTTYPQLRPYDMPRGIALVIQFSCIFTTIVFISAKCIYKKGHLELLYFVKSRKQCLITAATLVVVFEAFYNLVAMIREAPPFMYAVAPVAISVLLIMHFPSVRTEFSLLYGILPGFSVVVLMLVMFMLFFAWVGTLLFKTQGGFSVLLFSNLFFSFLFFSFLFCSLRQH